ncbi:MAG: hypothetical protein HDR31_01085 [Mycoplasma sp.]|nr:hypothetical protein [Mycoplasma sp.]
MWILIDAVQDFLELILIENNQIKTSFKEKQNKNLTKILIPCIANFLEKNKVKKEEIKRFYVINGPGSFTCVKLISVFINAFKSIFNNIEIFSLNSNWWFAGKNNTISLIDAKSNLFYYSFVDTKKDKLVTLIDEKQKNKIICENPSANLYIYSVNNILSINERWNFSKDLFEKVELIKPLYVKNPV